MTGASTAAAGGEPLAERVFAVLEWAGENAVSDLAWEACKTVVRMVLERAHGDQPTAVMQRQRAVVQARWRLWVEFEVELDRDPVLVKKLASSDYRVRFAGAEHDYTATAPVDADDLRKRRRFAVSQKARAEPS